MDSPSYVAALRILSYRFNSETELRRKLGRKKFEREEIEAAIERLRGEGWIDDARFAGALVRTRAVRSIGRRRLGQELQAAGVDRETAARAVSENVDPEREAELLKIAAAKRLRMLVRRHGPAVLETAEGRNKLTGYLLKQGYDAALVYETVKEIQVVDHQSDS